ncbi:stromal cell-derived factor 2-like protein [Anaeramoeba ignava]|uniref:Stromal cell-derived factor 2-like protein n=1 Tax=Anaeramoeba ignava TaxID=1746090 RepID=A0A9Q0LGL5_ANAIG|nr:stromal cell-derived factor 2-like protein [Anaeramoeba ignava]
MTKKIIRIINIIIIITLVASEETKEEKVAITCGSIIKLSNEKTGHRLHSHSVTYGTGSRQQSVTGFPEGNDVNSFWIVRGATGTECKQGEAINDGDIITLEHLVTRKRLHSHPHKSPLSNQQEVSAYDGKDVRDNWIVITQGQWIRDNVVVLKHLDSNQFLHNHLKEYGRPIPHQTEISCVSSSKGKEVKWRVVEGIFFPQIH